MLNNYLGIVIDPQGNYLTFGQAGFMHSYEDISFHGRSFLIALKISGWIYNHPDFNVTYKNDSDLLGMDSDFYEWIEN